LNVPGDRTVASPIVRRRWIILYLVTDAFDPASWIYVAEGLDQHQTRPPGERIEVPVEVAANQTEWMKGRHCTARRRRRALQDVADDPWPDGLRPAHGYRLPAISLRSP